MGDQDPSIESQSDQVARWRQYSSTYAMDHPTEWVPAVSNNGRKEAGGHGVFLKRCGPIFVHSSGLVSDAYY